MRTSLASVYEVKFELSIAFQETYPIAKMNVSAARIAMAKVEGPLIANTTGSSFICPRRFLPMVKV